jgi:hypothetical protein
VDEFYVGVALSVWPSAHERVAAKRNELGSWPRAS